MATDLFISYAREDRAFVERLEEALRDREREVWIDHEIRPSEPWRDRLAKAIEGANACVFVLSPDFVRSDECRRELLHAGQHSKRLIPIVWRDVGPATVDETLRQLNWIFFRDDDFDEAVDKLVEALDTDFGWLETHTRLTERAVEWQQGGKERSYLLSGRDLREMETWLAASADHRPAPTSLHMEYLLASRAAATRRQRLQLAAVTAGLVVAVALALVALYQRQQKERQRQRAVARQLAAQARAGFDDSGTGLLHAALLSAESLRHHPTPDAAEILSRALELLPRALPSSLKIAPSSSIALSGDGAWIAVGTWGDDVELVNLIDGTRKLMPLDKQRHELTEVALGEHGELLATAAGSSVRVWRWQTREEVVSFTPARAPRVLAVAEEAGLLAVGFGQRVQVRRLRDRGVVADLEFAAAAIAFHRGGAALTTVGSEEVSVWDLASGTRSSPGGLPERSYRIGGDPAPVLFAAGGDGDRLVTGSGEGTVQAWDVARERELARIEHGTRVEAVALSADGRRFAAVSKHGYLGVWDLEPAGELYAPPNGCAGGEADCTVALSADGRRLATGTSDGRVAVFEVASGRRIAEVVHQPSLFELALSRDGRWLVTGDAYSGARVWDVAGGREVAALELEAEHFGGLLGRVAISADGTLMAIGGMDNSVSVRVVGSGSELLRERIEGRLGQGLAFALSHSGGQVAVLTPGGTLTILSTATGEAVGRFEHGPGSWMTFSPDDAWLATADVDGWIRIWKMPTLSEESRLHVVEDFRSLALSLDPFRLLTARQGGNVRARLWRPEDLVDEACDRAHRNLTEKEWRRYMGSEPYRALCTNRPLPSPSSSPVPASGRHRLELPPQGEVVPPGADAAADGAQGPVDVHLRRRSRGGALEDLAVGGVAQRAGRAGAPLGARGGPGDLGSGDGQAAGSRRREGGRLGQDADAQRVARLELDRRELDSGRAWAAGRGGGHVEDGEADGGGKDHLHALLGAGGAGGEPGEDEGGNRRACESLRSRGHHHISW